MRRWELTTDGSAEFREGGPGSEVDASVDVLPSALVTPRGR
ncbi:hypothetical protein [Umezawaea sp. Da 62-37]|nr:hypothetical protein [Umezawaea sp. Da 62-37]WNV84690.1 hypothetical protein RM788_42075 [Umezawaea sp. Da 62-37]